MYKAAIVGCGRIAGLLEEDELRAKPCTHAGAYQAHEQFELVSCASKTPKNLKKFQALFGNPQAYLSYREMLEAEKIDILSICTPASLHAPMVKHAAQSGVQLIWCEKALATSLSEAQEMVELCHKHGVQLMVNHTRRWDWHYLQLKKMLEDDKLGTVQSASCYFSGNIMHTGTHMFDLLVYLFGRPLSLEAQIYKPSRQGRQSSGYRFSASEEIIDPDGLGLIHFDKNITVAVFGLSKKYFIFELDIVGTKGRVRIGNGYFQYFKAEKSDLYEQFKQLKETPFEIEVEQKNNWLLALDDAARCLNGDLVNRSSGADARIAMELALGFLHSARHAAPIKFPCPSLETLSLVSR